MAQLNVRIPGDLLEAVREKAKREARPLRSLVEHALLVELADALPTHQQWADEAATVTAHPAAEVVVAKPRTRQRSQGQRAPKCRHPITRRIGDRCGECGATVK